MKPENAIEVEHLAKRYYVASRQADDATLAARVLQGLISPLNRARLALQRKSPFASDTAIWALNDLTFEVKKGEIVGIIGANGSGKSTLLKILSRITYPTQGVARIRGDVGSLLEVGTGFHPELTGRENIYMNGAVLGMPRDEITRVFDEIVDFSGIGPFLDTPVKRYSSGMRVRLAFSVAAHFKPEVLLVDEVLSVGDAEFQKRGLGKMSSVSKEGRTVLMVSHNLSAILSHCDWVMWLNKGNLVAIGEPQAVVARYLAESATDATVGEGEKRFSLPESESGFTLLALRTLDAAGQPCAQFLSSAPITVELEFALRQPLPFLRVGFEVKTPDGIALFRAYHNDSVEIVDYDPTRESYRVRALLPPHLLNNGTYMIDPLAAIYRGDWLVRDARGLQIHIVFDVPNRDYVIGSRPGVIAPILDWQNVQEEVQP
jgi:lipopolysaccharide transport system ATP-binding protein